MPKMIMKIINNMLIELYATMAQAETEKKEKDSKKELLLRKPEENGQTMVDQKPRSQTIGMKPLPNGRMKKSQQ